MTLEADSQLIGAKENGVVILECGAAANLARFRWLNHHNSLLGRLGLPRASTHPAQAQFKFGSGRTGDANSAADITAGIAGDKGSSPAFVSDADILA